jgi:homoserine dehydrogenase
LKLLLLGYGRVAKSFISLINSKKEYLEELRNVELCGIVTRRGLMLSPAEHFRPDAQCDAFQALERLSPDILVDLSTPNYQTGEPSTSLYLRAFEQGTGVITANKAPLALGYTRIVSAAKKVGIGFQATVMSGTPSVNLQRVLPGLRVTMVRGILNGTSSYVLDRMAEGLSLEHALNEASEHGYTEGDPSIDLNGIDSAAKLVILANLYMGRGISLSDVKIGPVDYTHIGRNTKVRMVAHSTLNSACVSIETLAVDDPLHCVRGAESALTISSDVMELTIRGMGAGPVAAAYGVLSDLVLMYRELFNKLGALGKQ